MKPSNYDKLPTIPIAGHTAVAGWEAITQTLTEQLRSRGKTKTIIAVETYQGVLIDDVLNGLTLPNRTVIETGGAMLDVAQIDALVADYVTDDPVFGYVSPLPLIDFFDSAKLVTYRQQIDAITDGLVLIVGVGATLLVPQPDVLVYADMPRWEIQRRFRANRVGNLGADNASATFAYQYKRAFYVDWRALDRHKRNLMPRWDFLLDTTLLDARDAAQPKLVSGDALRDALAQTVHRPFRVVPFFDPGPWGGQWLKEVCDLDRSAVNFAWGFDCVPEENSLRYDFGGVTVEIPAVNLVYAHPAELLGEPVYDAFGAEFPIRFDFLDTMQGGNLSLQVHPLHDYAKAQFGIPYTQNESYYFLEADDDAVVYLGLRETIDPDAMLTDLQQAQTEGTPFDADRYVQKWPIQKHGHALIPAGTVHCSGANSVVLEISATPFNFTFKLWDWQRLGLDGKPRPISLEHGKKNIQWDRTTAWTEANLVNRFERVAEGDGWWEERTGLDTDSFIETRRHWFRKPVLHQTKGVVNVLNLVEGREAIVESPTAAFAPFVVHYAETFIVPAAVDTYRIRPHGPSDGQEIATIKASIRINKLADYRLTISSDEQP